MATASPAAAWRPPPPPPAGLVTAPRISPSNTTCRKGGMQNAECRMKNAKFMKANAIGARAAPRLLPGAHSAATAKGRAGSPLPAGRRARSNAPYLRRRARSDAPYLRRRARSDAPYLRRRARSDAPYPRRRARSDAPYLDGPTIWALFRPMFLLTSANGFAGPKEAAAYGSAMGGGGKLVLHHHQMCAGGDRTSYAGRTLATACWPRWRTTTTNWPGIAASAC